MDLPHPLSPTSPSTSPGETDSDTSSTAATSEGGFERFQYFLGSAVGIFLLFCWTLALVFHLMTGLRHLWMDTAHGYDEKTYHNSGIAVLAGTVVLTLLIWAVLNFWLDRRAARTSAR